MNYSPYLDVAKSVKSVQKMIQIVSVASSAILLLALWSHLYVGIGPKYCDGNYIQPHYSEISLPKSSPRYALFRTSNHPGATNTGVPVLFIPGNAGNHRQARSLVAVLDRIRIWESQDIRLDLFASTHC